MLWSSPGVMWSASLPHPLHLGAWVVAWHLPLALTLTTALIFGQSWGSRSLRSEVDHAIASPRYGVSMSPLQRRESREPADPDGVDLRSLEASRVRVKGTAAWVPAALRADVGGQVYVLRREPGNEHDANAIAVIWEGKKVGYVSAVKAQSMAPLLDRLGSRDFVVSGMGAYTNSTRLWVDLPKLPVLRKFVSESSSQ